MPTLLRVEGCRFSFYAGDGVEPPHVHVSKADGAAKIWLRPVRIQYGFNPAQLRRVRELTLEHEEFFTERWNEYCGR